jgi:hypothetical protein
MRVAKRGGRLGLQVNNAMGRIQVMPARSWTVAQSFMDRRIVVGETDATLARFRFVSLCLTTVTRLLTDRFVRYQIHSSLNFSSSKSLLNQRNIAYPHAHVSF